MDKFVDAGFKRSGRAISGELDLPPWPNARAGVLQVILGLLRSLPAPLPRPTTRQHSKQRPRCWTPILPLECSSTPLPPSKRVRVVARPVELFYLPRRLLCSAWFADIDTSLDAGCNNKVAPPLNARAVCVVGHCSFSKSSTTTLRLARLGTLNNPLSPQDATQDSLPRGLLVLFSPAPVTAYVS